MNRQSLALGAGAAVMLILGAALAGCSGNGSTPQSANGLPTRAGSAATVAGAGATPGAAQNGGGTSSAGGPDTGAPGSEAGGEAVLVTYNDPAGQFSFDYPSGWAKSTNKRGGIRFDGRNQVYMFDLVSNAGSDAAAFASSDKGALAGEFPGFRNAAIGGSSVIPSAAVMMFEWDATNPVTGKPVVERAARYYIPASGGRMAILTDSAETAQFDPQNSADLARTVRVK